jgi:ankyrin repeat protein
LDRPPQDRKYPLKEALYLDPSPGKCEILSVLLNAGASLEMVTTAMEDHPPLCLLAEDGDAASLDILLKAGADPQLRGKKGSALGAAVKALSIPTVKRLLEAGVRFPVVGPAPRVFLALAASSKEMIELLRENGLSPVNYPRPPGDSFELLDELIDKGKVEQINFLVSQGVDPDDTTWDKTSRLLLCGTDAEFAQHLREGIDLTKVYGHAERSPCELAVERDLITKLQLLFGAGADPWQSKPDPPYAGTSLLHVGAEKGSVRSLHLLLALGLPVNQAAGLGYTPLMEACHYGQLAAAKLLLEADAAVDQLNEFSGTALNLLGEWGCVAQPLDCLEILKLLHQYGADLNHVDDLREDGIVMAMTAHRQHEALRWLATQGADMNLNSCEGTPLRRAVLNDDLTAMEILLQGGADPNARLEDDETVLFDVKSAESVRLLLKYGADSALKDNLFDRTAIEAIKDPVIMAAFSET